MVSVLSPGQAPSAGVGDARRLQVDARLWRRNCEAERRVREDLILAACDDMECWDEINNKCGPGRALSAPVGRQFDRPTSVRRALDGFAALLEKGFHLDGFCTESPSYSDMFLHLMRQIPDLLAGYSDPEDYAPAQGERIVDFDPYAHFERYRLALESMIRMLDPNLKYPVIGDVRGAGLMVAVELVQDRQTRAPATELCARVVNAMRESGVLIGRTGLHGQVLKIRPPLVFSRGNADLLVSRLDEVLAEGIKGQ